MVEVWSRTNLHILTSIDYDKMSDADKAKEDYPRADHDYGLSWIRREGKGRPNIFKPFWPRKRINIFKALLFSHFNG